MKLDNSPTPPVTAPEIVEFWRENLKTQFNARMGIREVTEKGRFPQCFLPVLINLPGPEPPRKRRRTNGPSPTRDQEVFPQVDDVVPQQEHMDIGNGGPLRTIINI